MGAVKKGCYDCRGNWVTAERRKQVWLEMKKDMKEGPPLPYPREIGKCERCGRLEGTFQLHSEDCQNVLSRQEIKKWLDSRLKDYWYPSV